MARVLVDVALPHLDRPFDYLVPQPCSDDAVPGARVRVRFAGRLVSGYVLERAEASKQPRSLSPLQRVVSAEPVLTPEVAELSRRVAEHYAGTRADVLRMAVPPRHARTEAAAMPAQPVGPSGTPDPAGWTRYPAGEGLLHALADGGRPRAVTTLLPDADWPDLLARAAASTRAAGRGSIVVVPDGKDVARVDAALVALLGQGQHVALHADQGPSARYRRFLRALRGQALIVVGTRSAVYAPVRDLALIMVWDDGDDLLAEQRAPYPHARDVALIRAHQQDCGLILTGFARTAEAQRLLDSGWANDVRAERSTVRAAAPAVRVSGDERRDPLPGRRLPEMAFRVLRDGLHDGPVLVQVPRRGYLPSLSCQRCRQPARCLTCEGPVLQTRTAAPPSCRWCGRTDDSWRCRHCGGTELRAVAVGERRTAEELGRAFPGVRVRESGHGHVLSSVPPERSVVVATPGAEPVVVGGYQAAVLLDAYALLGRADLRAGEEALRRWMNAAALVRPAASGGRVVLVGDPAQRAVQALVRWDPAGFAERELGERVATRLPPAWRLVELSGQAGAVDDMLGLAELPAATSVLGPVAGDDPGDVRVLLRVPGPDGLALSGAVHAAAGVRSARRSQGSVRIRVDPVDLG